MGTKRRRAVPGRGEYTVEVVEVVGGPDYLIPMAGHPGHGTPKASPGPARPPRALVPTDAEVAALPAGARAALAERCARRVKPIRAEGVASPADAARALLEAASTDTPLTAQLRRLRRDFARLARLAREHNWTDETPVPQTVFGPMWPDGLAPHWWTESTA
jgi:hypothetical protein